MTTIVAGGVAGASSAGWRAGLSPASVAVSRARAPTIPRVVVAARPVVAIRATEAGWGRRRRRVSVIVLVAFVLVVVIVLVAFGLVGFVGLVVVVGLVVGTRARVVDPARAASVVGAAGPAVG
jgi:hypothetical protein